MDVILAVVALLLGLFILEKGADHFTDTLGSLARRLRVSESVAGLLTAGGEWEELVVVLLALLTGHPGVAAGNIIGSCIANLTGSMPLGLLGKHPLRPDRSARVYAVVMLAATALASIFLFQGHVSAPAGWLLIAVFVAYFASVVLVIRRGLLQSPEAKEGDEEESESSTPRLLITLMIGLLAISLGAELTVQGAAHIAHVAGLSEYVIGATVVAIGTTLPDKAISLFGGLRGQGGVVTANATGSNIFVLTLVLGLAAASEDTGLTVNPTVVHVDVPILLGISALVVLLFTRRSLHRWTGIGLLAVYVGYIAFTLLRDG